MSNVCCYMNAQFALQLWSFSITFKLRFIATTVYFSLNPAGKWEDDFWLVLVSKISIAAHNNWIKSWIFCVQQYLVSRWVPPAGPGGQFAGQWQHQARDTVQWSPASAVIRLQQYIDTDTEQNRITASDINTSPSYHLCKESSSFDGVFTNVKPITDFSMQHRNTWTWTRSKM